MFLAAALVQGEFRVAAQHAGAQARGTDQHAGAAVDAGAVAFHGRHGAGLHHEDARGPLGDAAVQAVDALAAQRAAAHQGIAAVERDVGEFQQLAQHAAFLDDIVAGVGIAAQGDDRLDERQARAGHAPQAPDIVEPHHAHALGMLLAGDALDQQGIDAGGIARRHAHHLHVVEMQVQLAGHGQQDASGRGQAAQHGQTGPQRALMGQQHGLGPGDAGIGVEAVDDQGLALLPQALGVQAQALEQHGQVLARPFVVEQVHLLHAGGQGAQVLVRLDGLHEEAAFGHVGDASEDGRERVPLER